MKNKLKIVLIAMYLLLALLVIALPGSIEQSGCFQDIGDGNIKAQTRGWPNFSYVYNMEFMSEEIQCIQATDLGFSNEGIQAMNTAKNLALLILPLMGTRSVFKFVSSKSKSVRE